MQDIKELNLKELGAVFRDWGKPAFHAQQVMEWIYKKGATDFRQMSNLPLDLRKQLEDKFYILGFKILKILRSQDGTEKFLFALKDKNLTPPFLKSTDSIEGRAGFIEGVSIPLKDRITACLSTQVGCKFACRFCASGLLGFKRNLTTGQMLEEALYLKNNSKNRKITHIVFMGIGEPLDNYENVLSAIRIINSPAGLHIGARRITISTCGIIPGIKRLAEEGLQIELSISLHASDEKTRSKLMPINKIYPLKDLITVCERYIKKTNRQLTFEYVLIKDINSDLQNAQKLSRILKGLKLCKVNLIPSNSVEELRIEPPNKLEILLFRDYLLKQGINATLRKPRGQDIEAACGQLRLRYEKE